MRWWLWSWVGCCVKACLGFWCLGGSSTFGVLENAAIMLAIRLSIATTRPSIAWKTEENVLWIQWFVVAVQW